MTLCLHESCSRENNMWLPLPKDDQYRTDLKLHPWCKHCGLVKNISDDRPHELGYWTNILSRIGNRFYLKQIQKRMISKELTSNKWFNDLYGITGSSQKNLFKKIVNKYCNINTQSIDSLIY